MKTPKKTSPEIYAVKINKQGTGFERRDFLKTLGTLTTATLVGCNDISKSRTSKALGENNIAPEHVEPCNDLNAHAGAVQSLCFSSDGKILASGSYDNSVKIWSVPEGKLLKKLEGHTDTINSVNISPDGKTLASGSADLTIKLWSVPAGNLIKTLDGNGYNVRSVFFGPDSKTLASGSSDGVKIWSVPDGKLIKTLEGHSNAVNSVSFSNDGKFLASGSEDLSVKIWSVPDGSLLSTLKDMTGSVNTLCFSADSKILATASNYGDIRLWSVPDGTLLKTLVLNDDSANSISFSNDGKFLASGGNKTIRFWSVDDGLLQMAIEGHAQDVNSVCFSPVAKLLASGSTDKSIKLWQWSSDEEMRPDVTYREVAHEQLFPCTESGNFLAIRQKDIENDKIKIFDLGISNFIFSVAARTSVTAMALSHSAKVLIIGDFNGNIKSWDLENRKKKPTVKAHSQKISAVILKKNNQEFITAGLDGTIGIWAVSDNKCLKTLDIQMGPIHNILLSPDEKTLIICSNNLLQIWSMVTYARVRSIDDFKENMQENFDAVGYSVTEYTTFFLLSPKSAKVLVKNPEGFKIYDYERGAIIHTVTTERSVVSASATSDGKYLAIAYNYGETEIRLMENMNILRTFDTEGIQRLSFLDDNKLVAYCSYKFQVYTFNSFINTATLSNCLYDKNELSEGTEGIRYRVGTTSFTLPCGSPIPEGSVCTCNCVAVGPSHTYYYYSGGYYVSYWYPN